MPGPYVQVATLCETALQEASGVLSIIRSIDRIVVTAQAIHGTQLPAELPPGDLPVTLVIMLKSDDAQGRHPVSVRIQKPDGITLPDHVFDVMFEREERGVNLILQLQLEALVLRRGFDL